MNQSGQELSSPATLLDLVSQPKSGELDYLLGVLQPSQFQLATMPTDDNLVVDGSPGSGKTVIAVHRAGYLSHAERERGRPQSILFVGPSSRWVKHVSRALAAITSGELAIMSMGQLEMKLAGASGFDDQPLDSGLKFPLLRSPLLWDLIAESSRVLESVGAFEKGGAAPRSMNKSEKKKVVYSKLKKADSAIKSLCTQSQLWDLLSELPPQKDAPNELCLNPLFAAIAQNVDRDQALRFDHLIIDEAQELSHLQWGIVNSCLNRGGKMTIFGDLNQQFLDTGIDNWSEIFEFLKADRPVIHNNRLVFRSTRQIIEFANLYARRPVSDFVFLREGTEPEILPYSVSPAATVVSLVGKILSSGESKSVAVFTIDPHLIVEVLRSAGWKQGRQLTEWTFEGLTISVLNPREARGLEFDVVIAIDPQRIRSVGGAGQIYTCLTRAAHRLYLLEPLGRAE